MSKHAAVQTQATVKPVITSTVNRLLQRQCACGQHTSAGGECEACQKEREGMLQRAAINPSPENDIQSIVHDVLRSPGQPLDPATCNSIKLRFGHDFSSVRVHTGNQAAESARAVNGLAYTVGRDLVFGFNQYTPTSGRGIRLLAHELTHTIQQESNMPCVQRKLEMTHPQQPLEREAETVSRAVVYGQSFSAITGRISQVARQVSDAGRVDAGTAGTGTHDAGTTDSGTADDGTTPQPKLTIVRQGDSTNTFVSTDTISFTANITGMPDAGAQLSQITWTVHVVNVNDGNGNPHSAMNQSNFSFRPNPTHRPTTGSTTSNAPIQYRVEAQVGGATATYNLQQDESDIIRQEYIDLGPVVPPPRTDIVIPAIATFNTGNYARIVDRGMSNALTNTQAQFQTLTQQAATPAPGAAPPDAGAPPPVPVPAITVKSGYRNPRRNVAALSQFPVASRHVWGTALDLIVAGANAALWASARLTDFLCKI